MLLPIRCMAASCGHRFESTAAAILADGRCPRCASTDIDVDEGGLEATAAQACGDCGHPESWHEGDDGCTECDCPHYIKPAPSYESPSRDPQSLGGWGRGWTGVKEGAVVKEPAAIAMDPASEVNNETARCAFCLQTYAYRSADPTEPVPACPHCGSTATTPAGAAGGYTALLVRTAAKIEEIAISVKASNPGMSDSQAVSIANETVRRYPKVVAAKYQAWEIDASDIREGDQLLDGIQSAGTFAGPASSQFSSGGDGWTAVLLLEDGSAERRNFGFSEKVRVLRVR